VKKSDSPYSKGTFVSNKVLSPAEHARLRQLVEDIIEYCRTDPDLAVEIEEQALQAGEILGLCNLKDTDETSTD
jgi:hypothetical protein